MKKILFILGILCLTALLATWFVGNQDKQQTNEERPGTTTQTVDIAPVVPVGSEVLRKEMQSKFADFLESDAAVNTWTAFSVGGQPVVLEDGLRALDADVQPELQTLLDQEQWKFFKCKETSDEISPSIVLSLYFEFNPSYPGNLYQDQMRYLGEWETSLLSDVQSLLYPKQYYAIAPSQYSVFRTNTEYPFIDLRQTEVRLPEGGIGFVGYVFVGDELLVGNNLDCLIQAQEILFDTSA